MTLPKYVILDSAVFLANLINQWVTGIVFTGVHDGGIFI
jgi:hypothetical protein